MLVTGLYIYIYIYLLIYYLPAFSVTKKKKKTLENSQITNLESLPGEKRKKIIGRKKKKRPTSSHQLKKIKRYAISWSKKLNPPQNAAMQQLQKVLNTK